MAVSRRRMSKYEDYTFTGIELEEEEQTKRLTDLVFNRERLTKFRNAVNELFNVFGDILTNEFGEDFISAAAIKARLEEVDCEQWQELRYKYLDDPYYGMSESGFSQTSNKEPAKLMMEFIDTLDGVRNSVNKKVDDYADNEAVLNNKIEELKEKLSQAQEEIRDLKWRATLDKADRNTLRSTQEHFENVIKKKNERIEQLERDSNVILWEKEKEKLLSNSKKREFQLQNRVQELEDENNRMKENLTRKLNEVGEKNKLLKLKHEVVVARMDGSAPSKYVEPPKGDAGETEDMKKQIYFLEKDLKTFEQELVKQQKYITGILAGLKIDVQKLLESQTLDVQMKKKADAFLSLLQTLHKGASEGRLDIVRADLPEYYFALDRHIVNPAYKNVKRQYVTYINSKLSKSNSLPTNTPAAALNGSTVDMDTAIIKSMIAEEPQKPKKPPPPELVHKDTGRVNMIAVMKHYPHMSADYVKEQWDQFKRYDTNGDYTLDLSEMMSALNSTVGQAFTAQQIKDALLEIDIDGSEDLDFYEYLGVASLLMRKSGKSEIFHSNMAQTQPNIVSKMCVIQ